MDNWSFCCQRKGEKEIESVNKHVSLPSRLLGKEAEPAWTGKELESIKNMRRACGSTVGIQNSIA